MFKMRGENVCRVCDSSNLKLVIDLGNIPIANTLPTEQSGTVENTELKFRLCIDCGLGQIPEPVSSELLFSDYRYLSSTSKLWDKHNKKLVKFVLSEMRPNIDGYVLEIASNDGYLLSKFKDEGIPVIGVEPSYNVAKISIQKKIPTINKFFNSNTAIEILKNHGNPSIIIALNVLAHVPDINDFMKGISILCNENTLIIIENPSILNILNKMQFDSIYQEHFSYLSGHSISKLLTKYNLEMYGISELETHGGSNRYLMKKKKSNELNKNVKDFINEELNKGLINLEKWKLTADAISKLKIEIKNWFEQKSNDRIIGFTAAAKAGTLVNYVDISSRELIAIIDSSPEKIGRFLPNSMIPIVDIELAKKMLPTDIIIFAWNIKDEIYSIIRKEFDNNVKVWQFIPEISEVNE